MFGIGNVLSFPPSLTPFISLILHKSEPVCCIAQTREIAVMARKAKRLFVTSALIHTTTAVIPFSLPLFKPCGSFTHLSTRFLTSACLDVWLESDDYRILTWYQLCG